MKKSRVLLIAAMIAVVAVFAGCTTYMPIASQVGFPADGSKYEVLGRVTVEDGGYTNLIKEAKKLYPEADDVVNVYIDKKGKKDFVLSGIAIKYNK